MTARTHYEAMEREAAAPADGGPAFPLATGQRQIGPHEYEYDVKAGMTLRDYFAAKAMLTVFCPGGPNNEWPKGSELSNCALRSYEIADAMLRARAEGAA